MVDLLDDVKVFLPVLQLTASPWTTEASTREKWQFGA